MAGQTSTTSTLRVVRDRAVGWLGQGGRRWWVAAAVLAALIVLGILVWPAEEPEPPRARPYRDETACLLTGERGVADEAAKPVWAGMQDASLKTSIKVQFLEVSGPQTAQNAEPFVATLAVGGCDVIFAAGENQVAAVSASASRFPEKTFVLVGGAATASNVQLITAGAADQPAIVSELLVNRFS